MLEVAHADLVSPSKRSTLNSQLSALTLAGYSSFVSCFLVGRQTEDIALIAHMRGLGPVPDPVYGVELLVADRIEDILPKLRKVVRAVSEVEKRMAVPAGRR